MTETRTGVGADLELIWREALRRTQAVPLVREALAAETLPPGPVRVVALGKAAFSMMEAALGLLGVVITHRVAGPVFVLGHYLKVLSDGRFPRMRTLRRSDELKGFYGTFLEAVEAMRVREARHTAVLEDALRRMRAAVTDHPDLAPAIEALTRAAQERRAALAQDDLELTPVAVPAPDHRTAHN